MTCQDSVRRKPRTSTAASVVATRCTPLGCTRTLVTAMSAVAACGLSDKRRDTRVSESHPGPPSKVAWGRLRANARTPAVFARRGRRRPAPRPAPPTPRRSSARRVPPRRTCTLPNAAPGRTRVRENPAFNAPNRGRAASYLEAVAWYVKSSDVRARSHTRTRPSVIMSTGTAKRFNVRARMHAGRPRGSSRPRSYRGPRRRHAQRQRPRPALWPRNWET